MAQCSRRASPSGMSGTWRGFPFPMYTEMRPRIPSGNDSNVLLWRHDSYANIGPIRFKYEDDGWCNGLVAINSLIGIAVLESLAPSPSALSAAARAARHEREGEAQPPTAACNGRSDTAGARRKGPENPRRRGSGNMLFERKFISTMVEPQYQLTTYKCDIRICPRHGDPLVLSLLSAPTAESKQSLIAWHCDRCAAYWHETYFIRESERELEPAGKTSNFYLRCPKCASARVRHACEPGCCGGHYCEECNAGFEVNAEVVVHGTVQRDSKPNDYYPVSRFQGFGIHAILFGFQRTGAALVSHLSQTRKSD
jgi:hypothetical protein